MQSFTVCVMIGVSTDIFLFLAVYFLLFSFLFVVIIYIILYIAEYDICMFRVVQCH